jgi:hypothetical protein
MNFKAIVFDTQDKQPMSTTVRCIHCDKNGKAERLTAHNGMQYSDFELYVDGIIHRKRSSK